MRDMCTPDKENVTRQLSSDDCAFGYDTISALEGITNLTEEDKLAWPCEVREFWNTTSPLIQLVRYLLSYGTLCIIIAGLVLNAISFRVLISPRLQRSSPNVYLLVLSIYDSCVLIFNLLIGVLRGWSADPINKLFQENEWLCILHSVVVELFNLLSIWMIVCLTIERLIVVFLPLNASKYCSVKRTKVVITAVTGLILAISCHKILVSGFEGDSVFGYKACLTHRMKLAHAVFFYVAFNTWLPTLTIIVVNILITWKVKQQSGKLRRNFTTKSHQPQKSSRSLSTMSKSEMKLTQTMKAVSLTYLLLVLPLGIIQSIELYWNNLQKTQPSLDPDGQRDYIYYKRGKILLKYIRATAFFFYQVNFSVNFFVYYVQSSKFKSNLWKILPCLPTPQFVRKQTQQQYNSTMSNSMSATMSTMVGSRDTTMSTIAGSRENILTTDRVRLAPEGVVNNASSAL